MTTDRRPLGTMGAAAAVVAGVLVGLLAAAMALLVTLLTSFGCEGTDVSSPPPEGSAEARLCGWPAYTAYAVLLPIAVLAPLVGGIWAASQRQLRPLALGCAVSPLALLLPAWFAGRLEQATGLLVLPVVGAFVAALFFAARAP